MTNYPFHVIRVVQVDIFYPMQLILMVFFLSTIKFICDKYKEMNTFFIP